MLISLGREELARMIGRQATTDVRCGFCRRRYLFTRKKLMGLLERRG